MEKKIQNFPNKNSNCSEMKKKFCSSFNKSNFFIYRKSTFPNMLSHNDDTFHEARISEYETTARSFSKYNNRSIPRRISYRKVINLRKNLLEKS